MFADKAKDIDQTIYVYCSFIRLKLCSFHCQQKRDTWD